MTQTVDLVLSEDFRQVVEKRKLILPEHLSGRLRKVTKTKPIRAKALSSILIDPTMLETVILKTIEGDQVLKCGSLVCVGSSGDFWQQAPEKMLAKYDVTSIDEKGWMTCTPKPGNFAFVTEVLDSD